MRSRRFALFSGLLLVTWGAITYYLSQQRPLNKPKSPGVVFQLNQIENDMQEQYETNQRLLTVLHSLMRQQAFQHIGGAERLPKVVGEATETAKTFSESSKPAPIPVIAVLVIACNRPTVRRNLDQLVKYRPSKEQFPIIVSLDCNHEQTIKVIREYGDQLTLIQQPDTRDITVPPKEKKFKGYYKISRHYRWALNQTFHLYNYDSVIIVEDDLDVAPDFFEYFLATHPLLVSDPTLWCVSAWNDNGKEGLVSSEAELLYRTDFFPGLGWMLTKNLWLELESKWPKAYWDDWMRQPGQRKDRSCIRPEISRTRTFGKIGVSNGLFYEKHLKYIKLNDKYVPFTKMNLLYLKKDIYDGSFVKTVYDLPSVAWESVRNGAVEHEGPVRITYETRESYKQIAKMFGLMDDLKSGVPRSGYRGVVSFMYKNRRVYLTPPADWKGYDLSWS